MLTVLLYALLAILAVGVLFLLASYLLPAGEQVAPAVRDDPIWTLPAERRLRPADVTSVRLPVAMRGYRFAETDELLDRLAEEIQVRDRQIARLGGGDRPAAEPDRVPPVADASHADASDAERAAGSGGGPAAAALEAGGPNEPARLDSAQWPDQIQREQADEHR